LLITGGYDKHVKRISVENRKVDKDFGQVSYDMITGMKIMGDGEKLLVGDWKGQMKLVSLIDWKLIKDFGRAHHSEITGIMLNLDQKFFFTYSSAGVLKR
jgi:hypothetical protein